MKMKKTSKKDMMETRLYEEIKIYNKNQVKI